MEISPRLINLAQYTVHIRRLIGCTINFRFMHSKIILLNKPLMLGLCNKINKKGKPKLSIGDGTFIIIGLDKPKPRSAYFNI